MGGFDPDVDKADDVKEDEEKKDVEKTETNDD